MVKLAVRVMLHAPVPAIQAPNDELLPAVVVSSAQYVLAEIASPVLAFLLRVLLSQLLQLPVLFCVAFL